METTSLFEALGKRDPLVPSTVDLAVRAQFILLRDPFFPFYNFFYFSMFFVIFLFFCFPFFLKQFVKQSVTFRLIKFQGRRNVSANDSEKHEWCGDHGRRHEIAWYTFFHRRGVGRMKHIDSRILWLQNFGRCEIEEDSENAKFGSMLTHTTGATDLENLLDGCYVTSGHKTAQTSSEQGT